MTQRIRPQIHKFIATARTLRNGTTKYFSITRLTSLKNLCKDPDVAAQFVAFLAENTFQKMQASPCPEYTQPADWSRSQEIAGKAVQAIKQYLEEPNTVHLSALREVYREAEAVQVYTGKEIWGHPIRTIHSRDVLVIEDALRCVTEPMNASYWAYQTARDYTERYNPHYGTGLIPESVPMLDDIIRFWLAH